MKKSWRPFAAVFVLGVAVAPVSAPSAVAKSRYRLTFTPAKPTTRQPITLTLKAPKAKPGFAYQVFFGSLPDSSRACTAGSGTYVLMRRTKRGTYKVRVSPRATNGTPTTQWCPGVTRAAVRRLRPGGPSRATLIRRSVKIRGLEPRSASPLPVKITLGASTLTATAPGRPDRVIALTGVLHGEMPTVFQPDTDITIDNFSGSIAPVAFAPDPLCPGATVPATLEARSASQMVLNASGAVTWSLVLGGAPSQVFGCGPAGPLIGTTAIQLGAPAGSKNLAQLTVRGSVAGIELPGGSQGALAASLLVNVDLSGKG